MARATEVPITPSVLEWALEQSGFEANDLAHAIGVDTIALNAWINGKEKPTLTQARKLASKLHRPFAALLLPAPPKARPLPVQFRQPIGSNRELNPNERRYLRRANRLQEIFSWLIQQLSIQPSVLPTATLSDNPSSAADVARQLLKVSAATQKEWPTPASAFDEWRSSFERIGIVVLLFSLGKDSCRGFSIRDDAAPVIAVNTAWNESARIFTLFHELGHLFTRTSSACIEAIHTTSRNDPVERWCERFAADTLMPMREVFTVLGQRGWKQGKQITNLDTAKYLARAFNVSLRAAVIRLIEIDAATWNLYDDIPPISDSKRPGGGGSGRNRFQIREDEFGERVTTLLASAVEKDIFTRSQAVDLLDIPDVAFDQLVQPGRRPR